VHEIKATIPTDCVPDALRLARQVGIDTVTVSDVFVYGPDVAMKVVSIDTSTPKAKAFLDGIADSPLVARIGFALTSREVRAIVSGEGIGPVTQPLPEPFPDIIQDFWQLSHLTISYVARAGAGATLLATGIIEDNPVAIVVAALFLPFLSQVLALSFGVWSRDPKLAWHGARALSASVASALIAGAIVAYCEGGPILFQGFKGPVPSFLISALIGITAGLSSADDTGRRYLIGVAASVQLAIFPVWFGAAAVVGLPPAPVIKARLLSFAINFVTIAGMSVVGYACVRIKGGAVRLTRSSC
jgi:hypothetical protein